MSFWVGLGVYAVFLAGYWFFIWSIWWHAREYTLPQNQSYYIVRSFFVVVATLTALSIVLFFSLPLPT